MDRAVRTLRRSARHRGGFEARCGNYCHRENTMGMHGELLTIKTIKSYEGLFENHGEGLPEGEFLGEGMGGVRNSGTAGVVDYYGAGRMDRDGLRIDHAGKPLDTLCPTCGSMSEDGRFCTECGEVFEAALAGRARDESFTNDK